MISDRTNSDIQEAADATKKAARSVAQDGKEAVDRVKDRITDEATTTKDRLLDSAAHVATEVSDKVRTAASAATDLASQTLTAAKDTIADESQRLAQTLRHVASDQSESVQRHVIGAVAGSMEQVADTMRGRSLGGLLGDVQTFARRNPAAVAAGAVVVGFALARLVRSASADRAPWESGS
jgi:vacuolar-type H+-ATPase subunit E/Vma4